MQENLSRQGAPRKKVTMSDIADSLGVSKNSVSLALSDKGGVSDALRKRIIEKAAEMQYGDVTLRQEHRNRCIALIVPEYLHHDAFFYSEVFWAIEAEAKRKGCMSINIGVSKEMETNLVMPTLPEEMRFVGLMAVGVMGKAYIEGLCGLGLPILSVDIAYSDLPIGCVGSANLSGGYIATQYLIGCGHREIGFVGPVNTALSIYERWCGFQLAMRRAGLADSRAYNIIGHSPSFQLFDTIEALEPYLAGIQTLPSAWFCAGDRIAVALVNLLTQRGVRVPEDVSVMGFDDIEVSQMILPRLSTIRIDRDQMGRLAVEALFSLLADRKRPPVHISIQGTLVERDSVRKV